MIGGAMTDPKGDRSKGPSEQADPDSFFASWSAGPTASSFAARRLHQTGCLNSHWIVVMPTMRLRPADRDYAIVAAIPVDHPGLDLHLWPAILRYPRAGGRRDRSGQCAILRAGSHDPDRRRVRSQRSHLHEWRNRICGHAGGTLHRVSSPLLCVQDRAWAMSSSAPPR